MRSRRKSSLSTASMLRTTGRMAGRMAASTAVGRTGRRDRHRIPAFLCQSRRHHRHRRRHHVPACPTLGRTLDRINRRYSDHSHTIPTTSATGPADILEDTEITAHTNVADTIRRRTDLKLSSSSNNVRRMSARKSDLLRNYSSSYSLRLSYVLRCVRLLSYVVLSLTLRWAH